MTKAILSLGGIIEGFFSGLCLIVAFVAAVLLYKLLGGKTPSNNDSKETME